MTPHPHPQAAPTVMPALAHPPRAWRLAGLGAMTIAARLHTGFALVLALLLTVGALGWFHTGALAHRTRSVVEVDYRVAALANTMQKAVSDMALAVASMSLTEDPQDVQYEVKRLKQAAQAYGEAAQALRNAAGASPQAQTLAQQLDAVEEVRVAAYGLMEQIGARALAGTDRAQLADFTATQVRPPQDAWFAALGKLLQTVDGTMQAAAEASRLTAERVRAVMVAAVLVALLIGVAAAWWISRSIAAPLQEAVAMARAVSQGDLSASLTTTRRDEIGALLHALRDMQTGLRTIVGDIHSSADHIRQASGEVASGNNDLSQRTELTASNLQEAAAAMQQLTGSVRQSAQAATTADQLAAEAAQAAQRGGAVVNEVVGNMQAIAQASRKIADITAVIDGIAFQTNLLALNAAVEAARAGEQGRGFAVVAGEVRTLAQRAAGAAKEIKTLIGASVERVESGSRLVRDAGTSMNEIVGAVQRVAGVISQIRDAAQQQSAGIGSVSSAVSEVETMTQQNAALVEQGAASADMLSEQASRLNGLIGSFRLTRA